MKKLFMQSSLNTDRVLKLGALLLTLLLLPVPGYAMTRTSTFTPGGWFTSGTFSYTFTITAAELTASAAGNPAGFTWNQASIPLPTGCGLPSSASGTGMNANVAAGVLTLNGPLTGFVSGETVTITSSDDPTALLGIRVPYTNIDRTVTPSTIGILLVADMGPLVIPGLSVPILAAVPAPGDATIAGTGATPGTYVWAWQNYNYNATGDIILGNALVNNDGTFDIALSQALLPNNLVSIGVSANTTDTSYDGQIVIETNPVPEPSVFALFGLVAFSLLTCDWRRRSAKV